MAPKSLRPIHPTAPSRRRSTKVYRLRCDLLEDRTAPALFNVQNPVSLSATANFGCVATGDFNGDGKTDMVLTNYGTAGPGNNAGGNTMSVLLGNGNGTFGNPTNITLGADQYVSYAAVGDLNRDGKPDIAVVSSNEDATGVLRIYLGNGSGGFTLSSQGAISTGSSNTCWVGIAQVTNGDSNPDVVVCGFGNSDQGQSTVFGNNITIFQGDGTGGVTNIGTVENGLSFIPTALALADFNGDGNLDIAAAYPGVPPDSTSAQPNGLVQLFMGNGAGAFTLGNSFDSGGALPINIQAADLNGDNLPDLVIANAGDPDAGNAYANFGSNSSIGLLRNQGGGNFDSSFLTAGIGTGGSKSVFAVTVADFNMDGKPDIAAVLYGNPLSGANARILEYKGDGTGLGFAADPDSPFNTLTTGGQYLVAAPLDANSTPDIVYSTDSGHYGVLLNTSTPQISTTTSLQSSQNPATSGTSITFTATVSPASGTLSGGTVTFFNNGTAMGPPVSLDANLQATFTTSSLAPGTHSITATYSGVSGFNGSTSSPLSQVVNFAPAATLSITGAPTSVTAGSSFSITVTALDQSGQLAGGYLGTVHFVSTDGHATVPINYTFTATDKGKHTFTGVVLDTAGNQTITATDTTTSAITGTSGPIAVVAAAATRFTVTAPAAADAGAAFDVTVTALDQFNNVATGYRGTVHFTSGDGSATLPTDYLFVAGDNGTHTFTGGVTLNTVGSQSVTATDTTTGSITGTATVVISIPGPGTLQFSAPVFTGIAHGSTAVITVTRTNGSQGAVSVSYATSDGTGFDPATAPQDYLASNGTLTWADGETGSKQIQVTTMPTTLSEGNESFNVTLSAPTGGAVIGPQATTVVRIDKINPKVSGSQFVDSDGDLVTVKLTGPGTLKYYLTKGIGPISEVDLTGTDPTRSVLSVQVKKFKNGHGDGRVQIGEIDGTGVRLLSLGKADLVGAGITLTSFLRLLRIGAVENGASIHLAGAPPKPGLGTLITAGVIGDGTTIEITGAPLGALSAISYGTGSIIAPSVGRINIHGKAKTLTTPAIPGDFKANVTIDGTGLAPRVPALRSFHVSGTVSGVSIQVGTKAGTSLVGDVGSVSVGSFVDSTLFAGYSGADNGTGTFNLPSVVRSFRVTGKSNAFSNSYVVASNINAVNLMSVDENNIDPNGSHRVFGVFGQSIRTVTVRFPQAFNYPLNDTLGDFEVRLM